jgi:PAS domain S-box-containing protein
VLLWACFLFHFVTKAQVKEIRRVLILNDLGAVSSPGFAEIDQALFNGLQESRYQIELYQESLELTLFPDDVSQRRFRTEFIGKYSGRKPDAIIAAGSASLKFVGELPEGLLRDTPIIFCTILGEIPEQLNPDMHFTGVLGKLHPEETLTAALQLLPGTRHVVVVGGIGPFDERWEAIAQQSFRKYEAKLDFTYLTDFTMPALLEHLKHLPSNTIVYHTALTQDAAGERFIDSTQSVPLVASAANAPVFVMDDVDLREGTVGGDLVNWADDARVAAHMAVRVLNGEKPEDIPIVTSNNAYMFDWVALQRWGLRESNLPPGSIILNRPPNFWQLYRRYLLAGILVILAQALAIFALLWQRARRRKTEMELARSNERLHLSMESGESVGWEADLASKRAYWFGDVRNMFGISSDTFDGQSGDFYRYVHPEDKQRVSDAVAYAMQNRAPFFQEFRIVRPDKSTRWIASRGKFEYGRDGDARRMLGVAVDITERKQAEEALSTVSRRLIEAQEEERTRIARELHDDINQRMALLAANLESLKGDPPSSKGQANSRIDDVQKQVQEIGSDIQALSHRLHSSKLDYLGLEVASAGFCRELSELHNVDIDFHSDSVPKGLPKEVSLCLFRVLQEALQNAIKHSGSRHFEVLLRHGTSEINLTVHDSGVGLDAQTATDRHGLGLTSMKERLRLVDGELSIESKLQHGTTIRARVPLRPRMKAGGVVE